jgi:hypothetical protein
MRLTQSGLLNYKKHIIVDNRALLDGDCEYYEYTLHISTTITDNYGHQYFKGFKIMFNRDISPVLYSAMERWIEVCNVFGTEFDKIKYNMDVPLRVKDSQEVIDYLNDVFDTKDNKVLNIRWAIFYKD